MQLWPITIKPVVANVSLPNKYWDFYCPSTKLSEGTVSGGVVSVHFGYQVSSRGLVSLVPGPFREGYVQGGGYVRRVSISSGPHHTYGCQANGMHPTGMLSRVISVNSSKGKSANHSEFLDFVMPSAVIYREILTMLSCRCLTTSKEKNTRRNLYCYMDFQSEVTCTLTPSTLSFQIQINTVSQNCVRIFSGI